MESNHVNNQKGVEALCLQCVLDSRKEQRGDSKKILNLLLGQEVERVNSERPDIVKRIEPLKKGRPGILLGIEHFRVDHLTIEKRMKKGRGSGERKLASTAPVIQNDLRNVYNKWHRCLDESGDLKESELLDASGDILDVVAKGVQKTYDTNYHSLLESLKYNIESHMKSVDAYYTNLKMLAEDNEKIQMAFLIELHAEFLSLMIRERTGVRMCRYGEIPLFKDVIEVLEEKIDKSKIQYIILVASGTLDTGEKKVYLLRSGNLLSQLKKRHVKVFNYLAMDRFSPAFTGKPIQVEDISFEDISHDKENQTVTANYECSVKRVDEATYIALLNYSAMQILTAEKEEQYYCASPSEIGYAYAIAPEIVGWRRGDRQELWKVEPIYKSHDFTELWKRVDKRMGDFQRKYLHAEE